MVPKVAVDNSVEIVLKRRRWLLRRWKLGDGRRLCMNCGGFRRIDRGPRCFECSGLRTRVTDELRMKGGLLGKLRRAQRGMTVGELIEIMGKLPYSRAPTRSMVEAWQKGGPIVRNDAWALAYILEVRVPDLADEPI